MNKIFGMLSIAKKAGYVIVGQDKLLEHKQKLFLILMDERAGKSLQREMRFLSQKLGIPLLQVEDLEQYTALPNCRVVGIKNKAISENIEQCLIKGD